MFIARLFHLLICILFLNIYLIAQTPATLWTKTLGGNLGESGFDVKQTSDGGFIVAGNTYSFGAGSGDAWLIKTNSNGDTLWAYTYGSGGGSYESARSVCQTSDGGFIFTGTVLAGNADVYLVKTESNGLMQWSRTYGGSDSDNGYSVLQTNDGGYVLCGDTRSYHSGAGSSVWLIRTNSTGDTLWSKVYGGSSYQGGASIKQTTDDGFIIAGTYNNGGSTSAEVWLLKTDENGDTLWTKTFGGSGTQDGYDVIQTSDGGYLIAGSQSWSDMWLIRTNASGDTLWTKTYPGSLEKGNCLSQTLDNGLIIAGTDINGDLLVIRTDEDGALLWSSIYGGSNSDAGSAVIQLSGGGYLVCGSTESSGAGSLDIWLIRLDGDGTTSIDEKSFLVNRFQLYQNYPNPFNPSTKISWQSQIGSHQTLRIYDVLGNEVVTLVNEYKPAGSYEVDFNAIELNSGVYFYKLISGTYSETRKMMLIK